MKSLLTFLAALALFLSAGQALAVDYICDVMPMYPVGGGQWMHYAMRYNATCTMPSPTGHIDTYASSAEMCPGGCTALAGVGVTVSNPDVYLKDAPLMPADLDSSTECRDYLVYQSPALPGTKYSGFNYPRRGYVEVTRPDGSTFVAVVFRMVGGGRSSSIGFEIDNSMPVSTNLTAYDVWSAQHEAPGVPAEPVNGLLMVRLHHNPNVNDIAAIRISNSEANLAAGFPTEPSTAAAAVVAESAVAPEGAGYSVCNPQCSQWCYRPQRSYCRPRRWRCR